MKRFLVMLTVCLMAATFAMAEPADSYRPVTSPEELFGGWAVCAANDKLPYLFFHQDGTYTSYDFWQLDEETTTGDALLKHGVYTFNAADSTLALEGIDIVYTAKTCPSWEGLSYVDSSAEALPGTPVLLLETPVVGEDDQSLLFLRMEEDLALLPILPDLCEGDWVISQTPELPSIDAGSFTFTMDGQVTMESPAADGTVKAVGTFDYTQGRLTITTDRTYSLLEQFHYVSCIDGTAPDGYDLEQAEEHGAYTALTRHVLVVHDLGDGSMFYLVRSDG